MTNYVKTKKGNKMAKVTASTILHEAAELKQRKQADYQGDMWTEEDYFPYGNKSYMHMIHTKYLRMRSLAENEDKEINFESLEDTLVDMAVYCAMFAAYLENKKVKEND
tara:strand:+ start:189 stop:515 length:327 start_codon:yes stop_codon:yes gene_type:complete